MKRYYIFTAFFLFMGGLFYANAQDLITLKEGNTIEAKVIEISQTEIKYKRFNHLDGPTIVVPTANVLSIRYENGMTEIINAVTQPTTAPTSDSTQLKTVTNQSDRNPRFNTLGVTLGYQGASAFGFSVNGTVSPSNYTFFDFNLGLGFNSFAFNIRVNFNAFVPFTNGGWYAGIGFGGGYNESLGGVIAGNITTGFIFFNWLNIAYTLQLGNFDNIVNNNVIVGYAYRFRPRQNSETSVSTNVNNSTVFIPRPSLENYAVESITGNVKKRAGSIWVNVMVGDVLTLDSVVLIDSNSSLSLILSDGSRTETLRSGVGLLRIMF